MPGKARYRLYYAALTAALGAMIALSLPGGARAAGCGETYVVQPGDWLSRVAQRCGVSMQGIGDLNPEMNPDRIEIGQRITLREPEMVMPVIEGLRIPMTGLPAAPPLMGRVNVTAEVVRDAGTCLYLTDALGRSYSFAAGDQGLERGMWVTISGEVIENWFCQGGAEVLVETLEPGAPATEMAELPTETL